ncbi:hypothetical protein C5167_035087 [Papaver somniferum]|uniref:Uncharacterized protein n=1 Tax=Papaver somniferum TaxID=3469 RepID=A0A4Y7KEZ4_PAPSO|nr:GDSL esterase/lipase At4g16230-like [Papaver somniferum]RZC71934.1 hypothetical protein C5167_035087 [Papaver somniferum]
MGLYTNFRVLLYVAMFASLWRRYCLALETTFPATFIFGDSLVDAGNNNHIATIAKANYDPYGIDFPGGAKSTGRFSNGRTVIDIIGEELGLNAYIPPYLARTTVGDVVFRGVNYASGSSGILNETGAIAGDRINLDAQIDNFAETRQYIISTVKNANRLPKASSKRLLGEALFFVVMGSNDFIINYFSPIPSIRTQKVTPEMFVDSMISRFRLQLTRLYEMDARKIVVANVGSVGCIPLERASNLNLQYPTGGSCKDSMNKATVLFNAKLKSLIMELNSNLVQSKFVYADVYNMFSHLVDNYKSYGFENYKTSCCQVLPGQLLRGLLPRTPASLLCRNRSKYVFWDWAHPTDATNVVIAKRFLDGNSADMYPMNIRQLYYA